MDNSEYVNNTDNIRKLKHSTLISDDIRKIHIMKTKYSSLEEHDPAGFLEKCRTDASFLFTNYTDIFNKIIKDEVDLSIMHQLLLVLKQIEDGKVDQHDGSVLVGKILKELYVDSAMRRGENLDKEYEKARIQPLEGKPVSWKQYKSMSS